MLDGCVLKYFGGIGRAEASRLALAISGCEWRPEVVTFDQWKNEGLKDASPWGSMPILELRDCTTIGQSRTILRFVGKQSGLVYNDLILDAHIDEVLDAVDDAMRTTNSVGQGLPTEEKLAARSAAAESGVVAGVCARVEAFIGKYGAEGHAVGNKLSIADIAVFTTFSFIFCGFYDGVPGTTLSRYPNIQAVRKSVAAVPAVKAYYDGLGDKVSDYQRFLLNC